MGDTTSILVTAKNENNLRNILDVVSARDDLQIIGVENDETGAIIKSERLKPDVLIIDLHPPGMNGCELAPIIHRRSPSTSIIMMCDGSAHNYAGKAIRAGISGFLLRDADMNKLLPVVKIVSLGGYYVSASITARAFDKFETGAFQKEPHTPIPSFSSTERGIITDIAMGFSDEEIAKHLNYSTGAIRNCISSIKHKTKQKNRMQIVLFSLFYGLIRLEQLNIFKTTSGVLSNNE